MNYSKYIAKKRVLSNRVCAVMFYISKNDLRYVISIKGECKEMISFYQIYSKKEKIIGSTVVLYNDREFPVMDGYYVFQGCHF